MEKSSIFPLSPISNMVAINLRTASHKSINTGYKQELTQKDSTSRVESHGQSQIQ